MNEMNSLIEAVKNNKITEQEFLYHQAICRALDESWEKTRDPNYKWLTEEEFWEGVGKANTNLNFANSM